MSESRADQASAEVTADGLLHTALHDGHLRSGARLADFAGWQMPIRYSGIIEEHRAVRNAAGLFDLSHMGELWVSGRGAASGLAEALVSDPTRLRIGRAQYSLLCAPDGGIIDDLIVYRTDDSTFLVVPNAANTAAARSALVERLRGHEAALDDATMRTSLLAIQGPHAVQILAPLTDIDIAELRYYSAARGTVAGSPVLVARTGYTGEDGFELYLDRDAGPPVWEALIEAGSGHGLQPCGLGARDTLRLEAGMPLYGNELDLETTPYEAGLGRVVKLGKSADFTGRDALAALADQPPARSLVGLRLRGRGIARHGYPVHRPGEADAIGIVTSGSHSPTLGEAIAMAYVPPSDASAGTMLEVAIRGSAISAEVVALPFYKRAPAATAGGS